MQSGGPTAVINASLVGAIDEVRKHRNRISEFKGALEAVKGIRDERFIDLFAQNEEDLKLVKNTPGAALKSSRLKIGLKNGEMPGEKIIQVLRKNEVRYLFLNGGNDTAENAELIAELARKENYELIVIHIPKTIDNDLRGSDHTPGYGSAAKYVACTFLGNNFENISLGGVEIDIMIGRDAGFLTAASALARQREGDGPHLIYVPEIPFSNERFLGDLNNTLTKYGRAVAAVSEGIKNENLMPIGWDGTYYDYGNY